MAGNRNSPPSYRIEDKRFELVISDAEIGSRVRELARYLNDAYEDRQPVLLPVLTGALIFFGDLMPLLTMSYLISPLKISTYGGRMAKEDDSAHVNIPAFPIEVKGRDIILLEDIVDTGATLAALEAKLLQAGASSVYVAALLFKPDAFVGPRKADWVGFEIPNEFVIGHGLDYAEKGRHLRGLYRLRST
jgi:hypoxanthine phosphoribosyltransferase